MLGQDADKPFHTAEHGAVNHDRTVFFAVRAGVLELEPLGHLEVELQRGALPGAADGVDKVEVRFWPVKGAVALVDAVFDPLALKGLAQRFGRRCPTVSISPMKSSGGSTARRGRGS